MKRIIALLTIALICLNSVNCFATDKKEKIYLYVEAEATNGNGSKEKPFGTFEEARDEIRKIKENGEYPEGGIVVYFREGIYKYTKSVDLTTEDSGTKDAPVVYRAYMNEKPVFVGGSEMPVSSFEKVTDESVLKRLNETAKDKILYANLKDKFGITEYGELNMFGMGVGYYNADVAKMAENNVIIPTEQPPEIFFGDIPGTIARYPNEGYIGIDELIQKGDDIQRWSHTYVTREGYVPYEERVYPPKPSVFRANKDTRARMEKWVNEDEVWVYGYFSVNWSDISLPVSNIDYDEGIITTKYPSPIEMKDSATYYIYNVLGELDAPGEYFLDRSTGNLYIYPTAENDSLTFSDMKDNFLEITGASYIKFKGLTFKGSKENAVVMYGCKDVDFELCSIEKTAKFGIIAKNCVECNFTSCHIYHTGTGGINLSNTPTSDPYKGADIQADCDKNLTPQNNIVENCDIHEFSRVKKTYSPAVILSGVGNSLINSKIHNGDHYGIATGGNDLLVENNEFTDLLKTADDSGVIYAGFEKERQGLVIRNNIFHDIYSSTNNGSDISMLYPDDTNSGWTVTQNLFINIGGRALHSNGGDNHTVTDNIAVNLDNQFVNFGAHKDDIAGKYAWDRYNFQKYLDNPAYAKYPNFAELTPENYLKVTNIYTDRNVLLNVAADITGSAYIDHADKNRINSSYQILSDPGFKDMENGDYTLRSDSFIYKKFPDFKAPDFENMGLYTPKLMEKLESNISFLAGSPKAYNGVNAEEITKTNDAMPKIAHGTCYLPLRYITKTLGGEISYDEKTEQITVNYNGKVVVINPKDYFTVNGTALVTANKISKTFDTKVKIYDNGVIIVGKEIKIADNENKLLDELYRRLDNE